MQAILETTQQPVALTQVTGFLAAKPPFDFSKSLRFLQGFAPVRGEQVLSLEQPQLTKVISLNGEAIVFKLWSSSDTEAAGLNYTLLGKALDSTLIEQAEAAISAFLSLQDDLTEFYKVAQQDLLFRAVLERFYGYHQVRFLTPFENGVWSILTQHTPMSVASTLKARLVEQYGPKLLLPAESAADKDKNESYQAFPEAKIIAQLALTELATLLGNVRKAEYIHNLALAFTDTLAPTETDKLDRETLKQRLLAVKGIGAWSAEFILIRGYGQMGGLPTGESRLHSVVSHIYKQGKPVTATEVAAFAQPYGDFKGYWAYYLRNLGEGFPG
jgi:DNA-3-methyladenine glycosylase II